MTAVTTALGAALPLALSRDDIATYVSALFVVYTILILLNILISFVPRMPYSPWLRAVLDFITETTDPYLNIFRSFMRPVGGGGFAFDLSPILALIVLGIAEGIVVGALS
jgi:YggT family protein